jgi:uncharacterized oligopeptide transporter (OPT) family protein
MRQEYSGSGTPSHGSTFGVTTRVRSHGVCKTLLTKADWAINIENWGWYVSFTPAFIGSGMLVGLNVSISFFMGSVIAWYVSNALSTHV